MPSLKKYKKTNMKVTNKVAKEIFSLLLHSELDAKKQSKVIKF